MKQKSNNTPRGIRNNNPLNIRRNVCNKWRGAIPYICADDKEFEQFTDLKYGFRAAFILLYNYRRLYGLTTIKDIISTWSPIEDDNNVEVYISTVCHYTGWPADYEIVEPRDFMKLVHVMAFVECGVWFSEEAVIEGFYLSQYSRFMKGGVPYVQEDSNRAD